VKLHAQNPPHIRTRESNSTFMTDAIIATLPLYAMATYFYGTRVLIIAALSVLITVLIDAFCQMLKRSVPNIRDGSAIVTGLIIPLLMPASARIETVAVAAIFAITVVKHPFGGAGHNIFNPAAAGVAFATVCWPKRMFMYPIPFDQLPLKIDGSVKLITAPAHTLALGGVPTTDMLDMLLGNFPGPMGATNILVLCTCLLFLVVRKTIALSTTVSFLAGYALIAWNAPRAVITPMQSVLLETMSGLTLFGAIFLINDPVTSPKRRLPRIAYGFFTGMLCMHFRHIGRYEESFLFALLIMNAAVWLFDLWGEYLNHILRRKKVEHKTNQALSQETDDNLGTDQE